MTVQELFEKELIDDVEFISYHFEGPYWENSQNFLYQNWSRKITDLTDKQQAWLYKILECCVEKRIESER